ncbi:MAG: 50S ribosomal protein L2 [Candidatus Colwellbacteria bacterium]|nr:50S ribosomal protein L2 [Candidatus Colwellbacteria bacterium]
MKEYSPYTPSRRHMTVVRYGVLSRVRPMKSALKKLKKHAGRNNLGRITVRHQGGGVKQFYRLIDFKQMKYGVPGKVETLEYDPNRTCFIMRVLYKDGERRYLIAPTEVKVGDRIISGDETPLNPGNRLQLKNIPIGYAIYNIELTPGKGGQIVRSAGNQAQVLAHEAGFTNVKLPSGEVRKVLWGNYASLGQVSNPDHNLVKLGKAGRVRHMGVRPTVRGTAMNPVDHPYGGGEGRQKRGIKRPKTKWGKVTGGVRTRKDNKWSNALIVSRRTKKKK